VLRRRKFQQQHQQQPKYSAVIRADSIVPREKGSEHGKVLCGAEKFLQNAESRQGKHITELSSSRAVDCN
jgi:hypothetical protein